MGDPKHPLSYWCIFVTVHLSLFTVHKYLCPDSSVLYFAFCIQWFQWCILICTWCILLLFCCILFNSNVSYFYIVASWTTISFTSASLLFTLCLWSVINYLLYILRFAKFYLQRGILSNSSPKSADANGWKYRVVTIHNP